MNSLLKDYGGLSVVIDDSKDDLDSSFKSNSEHLQSVIASIQSFNEGRLEDIQPLYSARFDPMIKKSLTEPIIVKKKNLEDYIDFINQDGAANDNQDQNNEPFRVIDNEDQINQ